MYMLCVAFYTSGQVHSRLSLGLHNGYVVTQLTPSHHCIIRYLYIFTVSLQFWALFNDLSGHKMTLLHDDIDETCKDQL